MAVFALAAAIAVQKIRSFDYWWHLRTGAWIAETGAVPRVDSFTYTVPGERWVDIHWLFQLGLYAVYRLGGHEGVVLAKGALAVALTAILALTAARRERAWLAAVALVPMLLLAGDRFMPRPELLTFLCLAGQLALLRRFERRGDAWVYGVVPIQLLWVNVHGLFAVGLAVLAIHLVAEAARPVVAPGEGLRPARLRRLAAVAVLSLLASLVNPNGLDGALYPVQQLGMIGPPEERGVFGSVIAELVPPLAAGGLGAKPPQRALFLGMGLLALVAMVANWRRLRAADPLLWVAFGYLALGAQRNLALFAIVAVPIVTQNLNEVLDRWAPPRGLARAGARFGAAATAALAVGVLLLAWGAWAGSLLPRLGIQRAPGLGIMEVIYPVGAADWIERERPAGRLCHHMADGGYLIWRLHPDYPVMTDGRLEVFGPERFVELQFPGPDEFRRVDAKYRCGTVLLHYSLIQTEALIWWLHLNPNWRLVFVDEVAALFERVGPGSPRRAEVDLDAPDLFSRASGPRGVEDMIRRTSRATFLAAVRRDDRALEQWREALALYPDLPQGRLVHARLLHRNGFGAAAEAILRSLLAERPRDALLHTQVGDLRLESGDLEAARELYDLALALEPALGSALQRRGAVAEAEGDLDLAVSLYARAVAGSHPADPVALRAAARLRALGGGGHLGNRRPRGGSRPGAPNRRADPDPAGRRSRGAPARDP